MSGLKRVLGGGQLFLTEYTAPANGGFVAFTARLPGVIRELRIDPADNYMVQSDSYTCSTPDVEISVGIQKKLGAGIFGGGGVIFQRLSGKPDGVGADPGRSSSTTSSRASRCSSTQATSR
ncbi:MAG: AIM24 family protein [Actinomycetales bacterium]